MTTAAVQICKTLGLTTDYYTEYRFECAMRYIEERDYLERYKEYLVSNKMYWNWYYNQFEIIDKMLLSMEEYMEMRNDMRLQYFHIIHKKNEVKIIIPRFILNSKVLKTN